MHRQRMTANMKSNTEFDQEFTMKVRRGGLFAAVLTIVLLPIAIAPGSAWARPQAPTNPATLPAGTASALQATQIPAAIQVPAGHTVFLKTRAAGTLTYSCIAFPDNSMAWRFMVPQSTLFIDLQAANGQTVQQIATHFVSFNPSAGRADSTWQGSSDTSKVWGVRIAATTVAPDAIPWLLLEASGTQPGPAGGSFFSQTKFIQRINTSGGLAPSTGCSQTANIGAIAFVPYTADYLFYKAGK